jgi:hypothetical protein
MTKAIFILTLLITCSYFCNAQRVDTATAYFNNDLLDDTLCYHYAWDSVEGPVYRVHLICGSGKVYDFAIGVGFESMVISSRKRGWINTYQFKGGNTGFTIWTEYKYDQRYDDWLEVTETVSSPGERTEIYRRTTPMGISGKEYPKGITAKEQHKEGSLSEGFPSLNKQGETAMFRRGVV